MDTTFLLAALDAFRRCAEGAGGADQRLHWYGLADQAWRALEAQNALDGAVFAAVNDAGYVVGQHHHRARLTDADVDLIHELAAEGLSQAQIAAKLDDKGAPVARSTIGHILSGRRRGQSTMGHRLVSRAGEPMFRPAHPDEFDLVVH